MLVFHGVFDAPNAQDTWPRLSSPMASRNTATWMAFMPQLLGTLRAPRAPAEDPGRSRWSHEAWLDWLDPVRLSARPSARVCSSEARSSMRYLLIRVYLGMPGRPTHVDFMGSQWKHGNIIARQWMGLKFFFLIFWGAPVWELPWAI